MDRFIALEVAWSLHGTPYIWGGDDPTGLDCSGLVVEILKSDGTLPRAGDWTANDLWIKYRSTRTDTPDVGCLAFWFRGGLATHVEFCIGREYTMGASGGGPRTVNAQIAADQDAYVKVRPIRPGAVICDPYALDRAP